MSYLAMISCILQAVHVIGQWSFGCLCRWSSITEVLLLSFLVYGTICHLDIPSLWGGFSTKCYIV